jgi:hypothetical protein
MVLVYAKIQPCNKRWLTASRLVITLTDQPHILVRPVARCYELLEKRT